MPTIRRIFILTEIEKKLEVHGIKAYQIDVSIQCELNLSGWLMESEPEEYIQNYYIEFILTTYTDEENPYEEKEIIGRARCSYMSGYDSVHDEYTDLRDMADSDSGDLLTAVVPVTQKNGVLLDEYMGMDIMYIKEFFIKPQYRGKGIGQAVFPLILDVIGRDAGVITIIPCPTDDTGKHRLEKDDPRYNQQLKLMTKFIKKFGFIQIDKKNRVWAKDPN